MRKLNLTLGPPPIHKIPRQLDEVPATLGFWLELGLRRVGVGFRVGVT